MAHSVIAGDLPKFFRTSDFGVIATRADDSEIKVVRSDRYNQITAGDMEIETQPVTFLAQTTDAVAHDEALTIDGVGYVVTHIESNQGIDTVWLRPS